MVLLPKMSPPQRLLSMSNTNSHIEHSFNILVFQYFNIFSSTVCYSPFAPNIWNELSDILKITYIHGVKKHFFYQMNNEENSIYSCFQNLSYFYRSTLSIWFVIIIGIFILVFIIFLCY